MKAKKLMLLVAFAGFGLYAESALAQGNDQTESTPPPVTEESAATTGEETEPYNEKVTLDDGASAPAEASSEESFTAQPEKREKLRVYSGKHDGNNVISDPR
jgi:hypothetical protein